MEPLYAALSFAAVAIVLLNVGRFLVERATAKRAQRRVMSELEPIRSADEATVADVSRVYGITVSAQTPIYELTGRLERTPVSTESESGHHVHVGGVQIAPECVSALSEAGIALEGSLPGNDPAHERLEEPSARVDRPRRRGPPRSVRGRRRVPPPRRALLRRRRRSEAGGLLRDRHRRKARGLIVTKRPPSQHARAAGVVGIVA